LVTDAVSVQDPDGWVLPVGLGLAPVGLGLGLGLAPVGLALGLGLGGGVPEPPPELV
jgi:hypothetical protein